MEFVESAVLIWASVWAWRAGARLLHGDRNSLLIVYFVFYAEYVVGIGLDLILGIPSYFEQPGFTISCRDPYVRMFYCVFIILVPLILVWNVKSHTKTAYTPSPRWVITIFRLGYILPVCLVFLAPDPKVYLTYPGAIGIDDLGIAAFHIIVSMATMFAVFCIAGRCLVDSLNRRIITEVVLATALSIWINGKRYIVAEALMLVILALWYRGAVTGKKLFWTMLIGVSLLGVFSVSYQFYIRSISFAGSSRDDAIENARVDYTRDSRVKMSLYSVLYPDKMQILKYPGQNMLYYATIPIPRRIWKDKPPPYSDYFTCAMLNEYPHYLGWGMTTGVFDEAISNFGLFGILIGPFLIRWFCAVGDTLPEWGAHILTCVIGCLLMSVQLAAFAPLIFVWLLIVVRNKRSFLWKRSEYTRRKVKLAYEGSSGD